MRNYFLDRARRPKISIATLAGLWGKERWNGCGRFPPDGEWMGVNRQPEIRKCEYCEARSVMTVRLQNPREKYWLCEVHEEVFYSMIGKK